MKKIIKKKIKINNYKCKLKHKPTTEKPSWKPQTR